MTEKVSKDEEIGFHKGAIDTLVKERNELAKIVNITTQLLQAHIKRLKELGVDITPQEETKPDESSTDFDLD